MLCRPLPPSFLLVYSLALLDLGWNTPCIVPMSVSFRSSRLQVTTAAGYRMTGTAKVLIAVTLFFARELAPQNLPHSVSVVRGGFAAYLFVIVVE